jgi:hypothetical protein
MNRSASTLAKRAAKENEHEQLCDYLWSLHVDPPSPKAALAVPAFFYGIGVSGEPHITAVEATIAGQYVAAGKSQSDADKEIVWFNVCFSTYEVPPETRMAPQADGELGERPRLAFHGNRATVLLRDHVVADRGKPNQ